MRIPFYGRFDIQGAGAEPYMFQVVYFVMRGEPFSRAGPLMCLHGGSQDVEAILLLRP